MKRSAWPSIVLFSTLGFWLTLSACAASPPSGDAPPPAGDSQAETPPAGEPPVEEGAAGGEAASGETVEPAAAAAGSTSSACAGGVAFDDGTVETGYGYVPSAIDGRYVQEFLFEQFAAPRLDRVCVCWLRTRDDDSIDFEVVFHAAAGSRPAAEPYASVPGSATGVPRGVDAAGRFYEVDVSSVTLRPGVNYIGVRWNPSADPFFFVCTDTSEETELVNVFSQEDRAPAWVSVLESKDPIFRPHRAILLRARAQKPAR